MTYSFFRSAFDDLERISTEIERQKMLKRYVFSAGTKGFITVTAPNMIRAQELAKKALNVHFVDFEGYAF